MLQNASILIRDEAPMAHRHALECLDRSLQDLMQNRQLFGGKVVILAGDFRQLAPVVRHGRRADKADACISRSHLWESVIVFPLTANLGSALHVTPENRTSIYEYVSWLTSLGDGTIPSPFPNPNLNHLIGLP